ncbi:2-oxoglutarate (2OG) and Fe(II)-dependent oxygenase superfamily protein [Quillaja saponaria]|uniref:2-oxoglutarate (2OG) and Fe(II)-dependent oxygenase superfamily protein n=1 Tax=Quillaja saponaria TaxID=32244 RepID=A0AAD7PVE9_QUISA|nr:2-oxoglutarate (2OG) and Fe(II)-dependent oxygenase superfamily protein [Quillaja saponaria]
MATSKIASTVDQSSHSVMSVQHLIAKEPLSSIPQHFVRQQERQSPFSNIETGSLPSIPTIDMEQLLSDVAAPGADIEFQKLLSVCKEWGLFQLVNHGVSDSLLEKLKEETEEFFQLPFEEKVKYKMEGDFEGYGNMVLSDNQKRDWGDRMYMVTNPLHKRKPYLFPELPSSLRSTLEIYIEELQKLSMKLLGLLARGLKVETREVVELFEDGMQSMRMGYYPPCPQPELVMGVSAHTDGTGITILNQANAVNGLQLKKDGVWVPVNALPNAFLVNIGDILEILSNGIYKSVEHRATVSSDEERISIAMFFYPKFGSEMGPLASLTNPNNPPLFKRIGMEDYVQGFFSHLSTGRSHLQHLKISLKNN